MGLQKQTDPKIGKIQEKPRKQITYPKAILDDVVNYYVSRKGITPQGNEWLPIQQAVKTMLMNGRTPEEIKDFIFWLSTHWATWDIHTVMKRMPEYLAGKLDAEKNKINPLLLDPIFKKYQEVYSLGEDWAVRAKMALLPKLEEKYPVWRYEKEWQEARKILSNYEPAEKKEDERLTQIRNALVAQVAIN